jgi:Icc-related predicted phosphoesterase
MRLLLVSDLHYSLPLFDWVVEVAGDFNVVVMAGDHLDLASLVDGRAQAAVVKKYFGRIQAKTRLLVCSGNHDLDSKNAAGEKMAKWLLGARNKGLLSDGESLVIGDTLFTMCAWWDGPVSQAQIDAQLAKAAKERRKQWIWIYHAPPANSPVAWGGQRFYGDDALRKWIEKYQPDIVMSGHVHEAPYVADGSWVDRIGDPDWGLVAALTAASALGGLLGARLADRFETTYLATAFTVLVVAVALYTAVRALPALF